VAFLCAIVSILFPAYPLQQLTIFFTLEVLLASKRFLFAKKKPVQELSEKKSCPPGMRSALLTGYNILTFDNTKPGELPEYNVPKRFVDNVNVVSVDQSDWKKYKYHNIEIHYKGETAVFQVWDMCSDKDCHDCSCTDNKRAGGGFLLDIDASAAKRAFGSKVSKKPENNLREVVCWKDLGKFNPAPIAKKYGAQKN
jgi:hypothetical protein